MKTLYKLYAKLHSQNILLERLNGFMDLEKAKTNGLNLK
jgi:hypothetical protein